MLLKLLKNISTLFLSLVFATLMSEGVIAYLSRQAYIRIDCPSYDWDRSKPSYWADINPYFGVWHLPHAQYRHRKSCFDQVYRANSYGARDRERSLRSASPRALVIGDSFAEGYGLAEEERFSNLLEARSGLEHLNFGTSGHFGPTQYYLLYKHLAKSFSHDMLIVLILPFNDFFDDDPDFGRKVHLNRYRPYWVGQYPNYQLQYFRDRLLPAEEHSLRKLLKNFTYSYNAFERVFEVRRLEAAMQEIRSYSGYYDYSEAQWERMEYSIERILEEARGKKVVLVSIPVDADYERHEREAGPSLAKRLGDFSRSRGALYVDLLGETLQRGLDWRRLDASCDNHWSAAQNQEAAQIVWEAIQRKYPGFYPSIADTRRSTGQSP